MSMMKRRDFLQISSVAVGATIFGYAASQYASTANVSSTTFKNIALVHADLFDVKAGFPSVSELNSVGYLKGVLQDPKIPIDKKELIINGAVWLDETAQETYSKEYLQLASDERQKLLKEISMLRWGDNWIWTLMSFQFEAMFADPIYGSNLNQSGWKWLAYEPGFPRPNEVAI